MTATKKRRPEDIRRGAAFAKLITQARHQLGWSQDHVARQAGTTRLTIVHWESGSARRPDPSTLKDVCRVLGVSQKLALSSLGYLDADESELQDAA